ncbi:hypothetical protein K2173_020713 [Erythroxylum novogranatense]|uniref:Endoglucanase n=1 Tax=Erythroxylum novogranatense TaxID=1862640 RepID=A0AAV8TLX9_9ROSI|nr:hypothetical protein K2173_020713 [Erythroxylum novogranatense]
MSMYGRDPWGGPLEINAADSATDDDRSRSLQDLDRAALSRPLDETQQSWLLGPTEQKKKKKYVDLGCIIVSRKIFVWTVGALLASAFLVGFVTLIVKTVPRHRHSKSPPDNYTLALHKALMFFNGQRSGKLPKHNNVSWRGNSCLNDGKSASASFYKDLVGGYYDAGDAIKFNFPASFAMTMLSWSVIEYSAKYDAAGELNHVKEIIKWGADYFLKTFNSSADTINGLVSQVGVGDTSGGSTTPNDHYCWMRPEDIDYVRPVTECHSCSDLAAEMAAALASASIVFKDNKAYSQKLVHGAKTLFKFSRQQRGRYSAGSSEAAIFYNSTSYWDEFIWGGAWLYYATGNSSYLQLATTPGLAKHAGAFWGGPDYGVLSWDNKLTGAQVLLSRLRLFLSPGYPYEEILRTFHNQTSIVMCSYLSDFKSFNRTKGGLIQLNHGRPQPLQYVVNAAFLATLFSDYLEAADTPGWYCGPNFYSVDALRQFAKTQIDYILGNNPRKMSYVVGFGNHYPRHVHHRGASIPKNKIKYNCKGGWKWRDSSKPNPNTIVGAMVAGPDKHDGFHDVRTNYNYTEPTLAGNAGLVAALVALSGDKTTGIDKNTLFSAQAMAQESNSLEFTPTWVVAVVCFIIVLLSLLAERGLHKLGKFLKHNKQDALFEALQKLKEELMLLGFISLLLTVSQGVISRLCIPPHLATYMLPCKVEPTSETSPTHHLMQRRHGRHLLSSSASNGAHCLHQGKVQLFPLEALHHLHIFVFVLAVVHVIFCAMTMVLGGARIRQWKVWEESIRNPSTGEVQREHHHNLPFLIRHSHGYWRKATVVSWLRSFFKQFYGSITKSDYLALRHGFITTHCPTTPDFDFHKYMMRTLEVDFKKIVGISWYLWLFVVIFLLLNVEGWHTYFWLAFLPLILLLLVGAKLEYIITRLGQESAAEKKTVDSEAASAIKPSDHHFWFGQPVVILHLIHFILFQNAFEIAFFFWILFTYGFRSCIMEKLGYIVPRLVMGVIVQVLCSYSTLPLFALVSQMGSKFKKGFFKDFVQSGLDVWFDSRRSGSQLRKLVTEPRNAEHEMATIEGPATVVTEFPPTSGLHLNLDLDQAT